MPSHGPIISAYYTHVAKAYAGAYFQWYQSEALAQWIVANGDNVNVIAHSFGADMAAEDVAAGHPVNELRTVDHVGWTRPNFTDVAANAGIWLNYIAIGGWSDLANLSCQHWREMD